MSSNVAKSFRKTVSERRRLYIDYSCWLATTEKLTGFQVTITPLSTTPLVIDVAFTDVTNKKLTMFAGGGVANTSYVVSLLVNTDGGQVKQDDLGLKVTP
jgi:hypothetical protein